MKILGDRVYLIMPPMKEYSISVPDALKEQEQQEYLQKLDKLTVFDIGLEVKNVKKGDEVQVDPIGLRRGRMIEVGKNKLISVQESEIMHIHD
jgi:hypothetical protein